LYICPVLKPVLNEQSGKTFLYIILYLYVKDEEEKQEFKKAIVIPIFYDNILPLFLQMN